jgi:hypothetical protein
MSFLSLIDEAELHREVYVAVLNSLLRTRGSKRALAAHAGISPQYLSYVLVLDRDPDNLRELKRTP